MMGMMGGFSLLWLIVPLALAAAGAATAVLLAKRRGRHLDADDRQGRRIEAERGFAAKLFTLARENGGELSVSDVVVGTGRGPAEVETAMNALVDGTHVTMEVDERGRVRYEFPELKSRYARPEIPPSAGSSGT